MTTLKSKLCPHGKPLSERCVVCEKLDRAQQKQLSELAELRAEVSKWRKWHPDNETLRDLQEQARARDGSYTNGLAAQAAYIGGLEARLRDMREAVDAARALREKMIEVYDTPEYKTVWSLYWSHAGQYTGSTWTAEQDALAAALAKLDGAK